MELAARLAKPLRARGVPEAERLAHQVARLAEALAPWAARMNLTGPRSASAIAEQLLLPPLIWSELLPETPESIVDIGSGAGIPGIPLALRFPAAEVTLVESRERRHHFQRHAIRLLGLKQVTAQLGRAEELPATAADLGVAQALAPFPRAAFHVKRWVRPGGFLAIPQNEFQAGVEDPDLRWIACPEYQEPGSQRARFLWICERR